MNELEEAIHQMKGVETYIYTYHVLFGDQKLKGRFEPEIDKGYGFRFNGQTIYIKKDDIDKYSVTDKKIMIHSNKMDIQIMRA